MPAAVSLRVALSLSPLDARRGVVRVHHQLLQSLGAGAWDVLQLTGTRVTGAMAAYAPPNSPTDVIYVDDLTMRNCGVAEGDAVEVRLAVPAAATAVELFAPDGYSSQPGELALRSALLGKVVSFGDQVGLLAQDFAGSGLRPEGFPNVLGELARTFGGDWQQDWLLVTGTTPQDTLVRVTMAGELERGSGRTATTVSCTSRDVLAHGRHRAEGDRRAFRRSASRRPPEPPPRAGG